MKKPKLFVQHLPQHKKRLAFDFCYSAKMGAEQLGIKVKTFEDADDIPGDSTNIVVGSVEMCSKWLKQNEYNVPESIDLCRFIEYLGRDICYTDISDLDQVEFKEVFIKPYPGIKDFTGFVVTDPKMIPLWSQNYTGMVIAQEVVDIVSEYRCYISNNKIVGMKHYLGDPLIFPTKEIILKCKDIGDTLNYHSYTLDFGVLKDGSTILVEANDGWAIGNAGLSPYDYYLFVRNRWLQMTGVRIKMELV